MSVRGVLTRLVEPVLQAVAEAMAFDSRHGRKLDVGPLASRRLRHVNERRIRLRAAAVAVADGIAVCRVLGRYKLYVPSDDYGVAVHLMFDGFWEMSITQVVADLVRPGSVAIDVGANFGYYTILLADLVGPDGFVHALEPNPHMVALLRRSLYANGFSGRVNSVERPVGATSSDRVTLQIPDLLPAGAHVAAAVNEPEAMTTIALDDLVGDGRIDFIKIDAEGSELAIWAGMRRIVARGAPLAVAMEFVPSSHTPEAVACFLREVAAAGFRLGCIEQGPGLRPLSAEEISSSPATRDWMLLLNRG